MEEFDLSKYEKAPYLELDDYKAPNGVLGSFQNFFKVYQKETIKIKNKTYLVKKITQNGRSTFYCPALQI